MGNLSDLKCGTCGGRLIGPCADCKKFFCFGSCAKWYEKNGNEWIVKEKH